MRGTPDPQVVRRSVAEAVVAWSSTPSSPLIAADLAYIRGWRIGSWVKKQQAQIWLSKATINGVLIEPFFDAGLQLVITDENAINSRTNRWDATTERSQDPAEEENGERRASCSPRVARCWTTKSVLPKSSGPSPRSDQIEVRALAGWPTVRR